jgi:hypothetical protein
VGQASPRHPSQHLSAWAHPFLMRRVITFAQVSVVGSLNSDPAYLCMSISVSGTNGDFCCRQEVRLIREWFLAAAAWYLAPPSYLPFHFVTVHAMKAKTYRDGLDPDDKTIWDDTVALSNELVSLSLFSTPNSEA